MSSLLRDGEFVPDCRSREERQQDEAAHAHRVRWACDIRPDIGPERAYEAEIICFDKASRKHKPSGKWMRVDAGAFRIRVETAPEEGPSESWEFTIGEWNSPLVAIPRADIRAAGFRTDGVRFWTEGETSARNILPERTRETAGSAAAFDAWLEA